ncbi:hypothetical protein IFM89_028602 [Coptis chinensis]|uniref:F-box domain-containing protein n=1 Tax=Coptis chinensis TaxID=261450 RepID=A0A835M9Z6_9MAGN|nr:hypothetical protein IFM89_028602 [Coptis chinensis]
MVNKLNLCKKKRGSCVWSLLQQDILWIVIERLDLIDCHCLSAVCRNWRSACKNYCTLRSFQMPKDRIPWLMLRKTQPNSMVEFYRPTTNKTHKIHLPQLFATFCLYSKDGWLLLRPYTNHKFFLLNLFTNEKVDLPELHMDREIFILKGTFSTHLKSPNCVIVATSTTLCPLGPTYRIYGWTSGATTYWKEYKLSGPHAYISGIWLSDNQFYHFNKFGTEGFVFDMDLNLKSSISLSKRTNSSYNMIVCENELLAFSEDALDVYRFDPCVMDWVTVDSRNLICFLGKVNRDTSFMIREEESQVQSLLNHFINNGCYKERRQGPVIFVYDSMETPYANQTNWINVG